MLLILGLVVGYSAKQSTNTTDQEILEKYIQQLAYERHLDVSLQVMTLRSLSDIHSKSPERIPEYLARYMALSYQKETDIVELLDRTDGTAFDYYQNNSEIKQFLIDHPMAECRNIPDIEILTCSIENALKGD